MPQNAPLDRSAAPSGRARYAKSRDTRARILAAALAEASESGFHMTSVARIASRAGVAVGNLNYHFGSRRELLRELMGTLVADQRRNESPSGGSTLMTSAPPSTSSFEQ